MAVTIKGDGVQFDDGSFQTRAAALQNRNMIVNGAMAVSQELGFGSETLGAVKFPADQWNSSNNTGTGTVTSSYGTLNGSKSLIITATSAVTDLTGANFAGDIRQELEAQNVFHLNSKTITVSFRVRTNWTGLLNVNLRNSTGTRSFNRNIPVTSGENYVSTTFPLESNTIPDNDNNTGLFLSIGSCNEGTLTTPTTDAWVTGNFLTATTSTQWAKITGNYVEVTQVQLEEGDVATPFEHRKYSDYLAECQRYFWLEPRSFNGNMTVPAPSYSIGYFALPYISFPVEMRDFPIVSFDVDQLGSAPSTGWTEMLDRIDAGKSGFSGIGRCSTLPAGDNGHCGIINLKADARL